MLRGPRSDGVFESLLKVENASCPDADRVVGQGTATRGSGKLGFFLFASAQLVSASVGSHALAGLPYLQANDASASPSLLTELTKAAMCMSVKQK
jgi:hypothetical protein